MPSSPKRDAGQGMIKAARAVLPFSAALVPLLIEVIDRATDAMIAEDDLPADVMEALDDLGNFLSRAAEQMVIARSQRTLD